jgi:hypothetical protein
MLRAGILVWAAMFLGVGGAFAAEVVTGKVENPAAGLKTTYSIYSDSTTVTTLAEKSNKYDRHAEGFLFPLFRTGLQNMAYVTSLIQTQGTESSEVNQWWDYELKKKKSHAFLNLALQTPLTLLFEIEESYRKCKAPGVTPVVVDEEGGSAATGTCQRESTLTVKGPIAVYGNFASSINVDSLLRNKQEVLITLGKTYNNQDTTLATKFSVKSVSFDEGLSRFFRVFNIPVFTGHAGEIGYGNGVLDKVSPLSSRQKLLLGISRISRQANERMLSQ